MDDDVKGLDDVKGPLEFRKLTDEEEALFEKVSEQDEKKNFKFMIAEKILKDYHLKYINERWYIYEKNILKGGFWREISERAIYKIIYSIAKKSYNIRLRNETTELVKTEVFSAVNVFENYQAGQLNLLNGVLDLQTETLRESRPSDLFLNQLPVSYTNAEISNKWIEVLNQIFEEDTEKIDILQRFCGYALQPGCYEEKLLVFCGAGGNGKGVITDTLMKVFGMDNCTSLGFEKFADCKYSEFLYKKMLNLANESSSKAQNWSELIKSSVSGEMTISDAKYKERFQFIPTCKHIISMNDRPYLEDKSDGVSRRMIVIEFNKQFLGGEKDVTLKKVMGDEIEGVFKWVLEGYKRFRAIGLEPSEKILAVTQAIKVESNTVLSFIEECCLHGDYMECPFKDAYYAYKSYCTDNGFKPVSSKRFSISLRAANRGIFTEKRGHKNQTFIIGIDLNSDENGAI